MACVASRVLRARAHQLRTSARLALQRTDGTANACDTAADDDDSECRDQGFTAARILVLAPTRHVAYCAVHSLIAVGGFAHVFHCRRFEEEYGPAPGDGTADEAPTLLIHQHTAAIPPPETVSDARARNWFSKPPDFQTAFKGNIDDDFRIGLRLSRRTLRLYTDFFRSDIVLASPLGLQRLASDPERGGVSGGAVDSLSSIEMALVLRTDTMLMQNWEHLTSVLGNVVNRMPAKIPPGTDFGRVQQRFLDGQAARYRQTVWLAAWDTPEMHAMVSAAYRGHTHAPGGNTRTVPAACRLDPPRAGDGAAGVCCIVRPACPCSLRGALRLLRPSGTAANAPAPAGPHTSVHTILFRFRARPPPAAPATRGAARRAGGARLCHLLRVHLHRRRDPPSAALFRGAHPLVGHQRAVSLLPPISDTRGAPGVALRTAGASAVLSRAERYGRVHRRRFAP
eukprot:ctg_1004.g372